MGGTWYIYTPFHEDQFRRSRVDKEDTHTDTQTYTHKQQSDLISLLLFFQNEESRLKMKMLKYTSTYFIEKVDFQRTTQRYIPGDSTLHDHRRENLKPYIKMMLVAQ
jgi:hypothetical protein